MRSTTINTRGRVDEPIYHNGNTLLDSDTSNLNGQKSSNGNSGEGEEQSNGHPVLYNLHTCEKRDEEYQMLW